MYSWDKSLRSEDHTQNHQYRRENPSFSSTLLDSIYRSIDEGHTGHDEATRSAQEQIIFYRSENMKKKQINSSESFNKEEEILRFRRACLLEKWMEKKKKLTSTEKVVRRNSVPTDFDRNLMLLKNSSSSSSDSSSAGWFSSSDSEPFHISAGSKSRSSCYSYNIMQTTRPKPIRTSTTHVVTAQPEKFYFDEAYISKQSNKQKNENRFSKTKSKALKIYGDLKKVKQPISPGGKIANFMNSLLNVVNSKKVKINNEDLSSHRRSKSVSESTCSSASSFSRSCLSKTPSSSGSTTKRSVRFCPVNTVILDEDCKPRGNKSVLNENSNEEFEFYSMEENRRRVQEVARDLLKNYQKQKEKEIKEFHIRDVRDYHNEDSEEDDAASCSSSDLFELDNFQELPVYETTRFDSNRAIATAGFIL